MKKLTLDNLENINGGMDAMEAFCAGFTVGSVTGAVAIKLALRYGLLATNPIGATAATVMLAIDVACLFV